jgi:hypothetical protein
MVGTGIETFLPIPDISKHSLTYRNAVTNHHTKPPEAGHPSIMSPIQLWPAIGSS